MSKTLDDILGNISFTPAEPKPVEEPVNPALQQIIANNPFMDESPAGKARVKLYDTLKEVDQHINEVGKSFGFHFTNIWEYDSRVDMLIEDFGKLGYIPTTSYGWQQLSKEFKFRVATKMECKMFWLNQPFRKFKNEKAAHKEQWKLSVLHCLIVGIAYNAGIVASLLHIGLREDALLATLRYHLICKDDKVGISGMQELTEEDQEKFVQRCAPVVRKVYSMLVAPALDSSKVMAAIYNACANEYDKQKPDNLNYGNWLHNFVNRDFREYLHDRYLKEGFAVDASTGEVLKGKLERDWNKCLRILQDWCLELGANILVCKAVRDRLAHKDFVVDVPTNAERGNLGGNTNNDLNALRHSASFERYLSVKDLTPSERRARGVSDQLMHDWRKKYGGIS